MTKPTLAIPAAISNPSTSSGRSRLCTGCPMLRRCKTERLWLDVLPCEAQLDFEVGVEYERDSSPSLWVMPLEVTVNLEAME